MDIDLDAVRADYLIVRRWWANVLPEVWPPEALAEADELVAAAIHGADEKLKAAWMSYLAVRAADIRRERAAMAQHCRDMEARIKAAAAARKEKACSPSR
jgi:hypothetical protein